MPTYLVRHASGQRGDVLVEDPALTLTFSGSWAVFSDDHGPSFAISADQAASIERIDPDDTGQEQDEPIAKGPAPQE